MKRLNNYENSRRETYIIQPIMKDIFFLNQKSEPATQEDRQVALDLLDTLKAHEVLVWQQI